MNWLEVTMSITASLMIAKASLLLLLLLQLTVNRCSFMTSWYSVGSFLLLISYQDVLKALQLPLIF